MYGEQHYREGEEAIVSAKEILVNATERGAFANGEQLGFDCIVKIAELHFLAARTAAALELR